MDGKALLLVFAALIGSAVFIGSQELTLGGVETGPSKRPSTLQVVADARQLNIRRALAEDGYDVEDPESYIFDREGLSIVGGRVAASEHGKVVWVDDIFPWYIYPSAQLTPLRIKPLDILPVCTPTSPAAGSRLANVFSGPTLQPVSIWGYSEAELNAEAERLIGKVRRDGIEENASILDTFSETKPVTNSWSKIVDPYQFSAMEVVVTETEMPVHLVLQTANGRILWNLSLAPGAQISGVTMLGGDIVALANLPKGVPVEVLTAETLDACNIRPARSLLRSDPVFKAVENGSLGVAQARAEIQAHIPAINTWNLWFERHFGLRDDATRIGFDLGSIAAVIGPIPQSPQERVGWHGFDRRPIHMSPAYGTLLHSKLGPTRRFRLRIERRAKEILGRDLAEVAPVETN